MSKEERCICCNNVIPEGLQVCPNCEKGQIQELKTLPEYYKEVETGVKTFEVRSIKDRKFAKGEILKLREFNKGAYTGKSLFVKITYILTGGQYGISPDYVILGIKLLGGVQ